MVTHDNKGKFSCSIKSIVSRGGDQFFEHRNEPWGDNFFYDFRNKIVDVTSLQPMKYRVKHSCFRCSFLCYKVCFDGATRKGLKYKQQFE